MSKIKIYCLIANVVEYPINELKEQLNKVSKKLDELKFEFNIYENELILENLSPDDFFIFISEGKNHNLEEFKNFLDALPCHNILINLPVQDKFEQQEFSNYLKDSANILSISQSDDWEKIKQTLIDVFNYVNQSRITTVQGKILGISYLGKGKEAINKLATSLNFTNSIKITYKEYNPNKIKFKLYKVSKFVEKIKTSSPKLRFLKLRDNYQKSAKINLDLIDIRKFKKSKIKNKFKPSLKKQEKEIYYPNNEELSPPSLGDFFKNSKNWRNLLGMLGLLFLIAIFPRTLFLIGLYYLASTRQTKRAKIILYTILIILVLIVIALNIYFFSKEF